MTPHTSKYLEIFTDAKGGGCHTVAAFRLEGFTLVADADLARLRNIATALDADPIPANILEVLELCANALSGPRGAKPKTRKGLDAYEAIHNLLKAAT